MVTRIDRHGGNIYEAARARQCRIENLCDFSASINPLGPPAGVRRVLRTGWQAMTHYPDPEAYDVRLALSKQTGLPPDWVLVGNGSVELIHLLPASLGIKEALVVGPTFSEYEVAVQRAGGSSTSCLAERGEDYRPPLDRVIAQRRHNRRKSRTAAAVFLCNPNSPTGQAIGRGDLLVLVEALHQQRQWAIIDEAFVEFAPALSLMDVVPRYPRLLIFRSATKFYGIPGLRLGYLVGHPAVLEQVRQRQAPWSVNALAQLAVIAALREPGYRQKSLSFIQQERTWFQAALRAIPGLRVFSSAANFLLLELPRPVTAGSLADRLRERGLLIRDCSTVPGLNARTIRIAVKRRRDNERLCRALRDLLHG